MHCICMICCLHSDTIYWRSGSDLSPNLCEYTVQVVNVCDHWDIRTTCPNTQNLHSAQANNKTIQPPPPPQIRTHANTNAHIFSYPSKLRHKQYDFVVWHNCRENTMLRWDYMLIITVCGPNPPPPVVISTWKRFSHWVARSFFCSLMGKSWTARCTVVAWY